MAKHPHIPKSDSIKVRTADNMGMFSEGYGKYANVALKKEKEAPNEHDRLKFFPTLS
jgi:hypothetical protein